MELLHREGSTRIDGQWLGMNLEHVWRDSYQVELEGEKIVVYIVNGFILEASPTYNAQEHWASEEAKQ